MASQASTGHIRQPRGRRWGWRSAVRPVLAAVLLTAGLTAFTETAQADTPVTGQVTRGADTSRTNWYSNQPNLSPATVSDPNGFGPMFQTALDGQIMAQPLVANGVLVVATENNHVYGLDPNDGHVIWETQPGTFGAPFDVSTIVDSNDGHLVNCTDLQPNAGITSTPVIDTVHNVIYVVANEVINQNGSPVDQYRMHALDLTTGLEKANFPRVLDGHADNRPALAFDATHQTQRPGLLLLNGIVYAGFSAHCQVPNWAGWVMGVNSTSGAVTARWADHDGNTLEGSGGGIWGAGAGLASDGDGQILLSLGNALTPNGGSYTKNTPPPQISNAVVRLTVQNDGTLQMTDFFVPKDENELDLNDLDLGSGGVSLLPSQFGAGTSTPHLAVVAGKSGYVYLLNRDDLGGEQQGPNGGDAVVGTYGPNGGVWSQPSVWPGDGGYVYLPTASPGMDSFGTAGALTAYKYGVDGTGKASLSLAATSSDTWGFGSSAVAVTSDGTTSGSAVLWAIKSAEQGRGTGVPNAQLVALSAVPVNGDFVQLRSFNLGTDTNTANKFTPPAIGPNGQVYAVNFNGQIIGFGPTGVSHLSTSTNATFANTAVGSTANSTVTFTATAPTTVTALTPSGPFGVGTPAPPLPATLLAGETLTVPVTFTPTAPGPVNGSVTATTDTGSLAASLTGTGLAAGPSLTISTAAINFGNVPIGASESNAVTITNVGSTAATISSVTLPSGQFAATGAPAVSSQIAPGASVQVHASFQPTVAGVANSTFSVGSDGGTVNLALSGTGTNPPHVDIAPSNLTLNYGNVQVGSTGVLTFTLTNSGGSPATISVSKPPLTGAFHAQTSLAEGSTIQPGDSVTERVTFSPTSTGVQTTTWQITANDGQGPRNVTFNGTGVSGPVTVPNVGGTGWGLNGAAVPTTGGVKLTTAGPGNIDTSGSAFYSTALPTNGLAVSFDAQLSSTDPDTGADGLTLTFADPASPTLLGGTGGGLGFAGISGVAVALDTFESGTNPSGNFVGISTHPPTGVNNALVWLATNATDQVPTLRGGTVHVDTLYLNGVLTVKLNGVQVLSQQVDLPSTALVGFTGGNGFFTDNHVVTNSVITTGNIPVPPPTSNGQYETAFQANTANLWTAGASIDDRGLGLMPGTSPARVSLPGGGYEIAFQANTGHLWTVGTAANLDWGLGMLDGTSPAITAVGSGFEVAFQANTGHLWTVGTAANLDWGLGMAAGTSPAIASVSGGFGYEATFQANSGHLWTVGTAGNLDWGLGMAAGTSPTISR